MEINKVHVAVVSLFRPPAQSWIKAFLDVIQDVFGPCATIQRSVGKLLSLGPESAC